MTAPIDETANTPNSPRVADTLNHRQESQKPTWDLMSILTLGLVIVGFGTLALMAWQNWLIRESILAAGRANEIAQAALSASQRAWIATQEIKVVEDEVNKDAVRFEVAYRNVGREPAVNFWQKIDLFAAKETIIRQPQIDGTCEATKPETGGNLIVYPSENVNYNARLTVNNFYETDATPKDSLPGTKIVYIFGCFTYETFGERHFSRFCFRVFPNKDKAYSEWRWLFCPVGNDGN